MLAKQNLPGWLPQVNAQVWILALGRLLSRTGTGFTLFYAPIFFVSEVGLSATAVGIAFGSSQISGIVGRFLGGSLSDSEFWGRRGTLLLSTVTSAIACFVIASAYDFPILVLGNLVMGFGSGLYWPTSEAVVADLTEGGDRSEAYALMRLVSNLGLKLGLILGAVLINTTGIYRLLFIVDGISFLMFFLVIFLAIVETYKPDVSSEETEIQEVKNSWLLVLSDRIFLTFIAVNILFTIYISQINTTLPLYFKNFVPGNFTWSTISLLFAFHVALLLVFQLPLANFFNRFSNLKSLKFSALLWGVGFALTDASGIVKTGNLFLAILALSFLAFATIISAPFISAFVADLGSEKLRTFYLSISSQCWGIGYLIGQPLGGWALDNSAAVVNTFWWGMIFSVGVAIVILQYLERGFEMGRSEEL